MKIEKIKIFTENEKWKRKIYNWILKIKNVKCKMKKENEKFFTENEKWKRKIKNLLLKIKNENLFFIILSNTKKSKLKINLNFD
jgi:hypothetical protein